MAKNQILRFEYEEVLDPKTRELCVLSAAAAAGCRH